MDEVTVRALRIVPVDGVQYFPGALFRLERYRAEALAAARPPFVEVLADDDPAAVAFVANIEAALAETRTGRRAEDEPAPEPVFPEPEPPVPAIDRADPTEEEPSGPEEAPQPRPGGRSGHRRRTA